MSHADAPSGGVTGALTARLRVEPADPSACAVLQSSTRGDSVSRTEIDGGQQGVQCRALVSLDGDAESSKRLTSSTVSASCVCPAFSGLDCIAEIECFANDTLFVSITVPDRSTLREVIDALRRRDAVVHLEQILPLAREGDQARTIELDVSEITDKQREAIDAAVATGYYERPRQTDLTELADRLGVSESAVSQRLKGAETTLIRELAGATTPREGRPRSTIAD